LLAEDRKSLMRAQTSENGLPALFGHWHACLVMSVRRARPEVAGPQLKRRF
jgi:hypothetical protein